MHHDLVELAWYATLGRLAGGAMHEVANPLLALTGTAELLRGDVEPGSRAAERAALLHGTGTEIAEVVRAFGGLGRKRHLPEANLSLAAAVAEAVALVRRLSAIRDVELAESTGEDCIVRARPGAVAQLVVALLLDAAAASAGGRVEAWAGAEDGRGVVTVTGAAPRGLMLEALRAVAAECSGELAVESAGARLTLPRA